MSVCLLLLRFLFLFFVLIVVVITISVFFFRFFFVNIFYACVVSSIQFSIVYLNVVYVSARAFCGCMCSGVSGLVWRGCVSVSVCVCVTECMCVCSRVLDECEFYFAESLWRGKVSEGFFVGLVEESSCVAENLGLLYFFLWLEKW